VMEALQKTMGKLSEESIKSLEDDW
jgi:hypothetical protein